MSTAKVEREHDDPKYILNLLKSIITVSLETLKIVKELPGLRERKHEARRSKSQVAGGVRSSYGI